MSRALAFSRRRLAGILVGAGLAGALAATAATAVEVDRPARDAPAAGPSASLTAGTAPAKGGTAARSTDESVTLNFVNADIEAVVRAIGQYTGRTFVIDPRVKGTMTLVTERPVTRRQAYEELLSALRLQGYTLVESADAGGVARVLLEADAKLQGGRVTPPSSAMPRGDQVVTQVFRLQYESATNLVPVLRPLIAPNNTIAAYAANNTLVITDYADNLRRLARIIEDIDSPATSEIVVLPVKYGLAADIAGIVNKVLDEGSRSSGQGADAGQRVLVQAEPRSNSLILRAASRARLEQAKSLIERFDQPSATPGNINVIYLRNAQATKLAPLLRAVLSSDPTFVAQAGTATSLSSGSSGTSSAGTSGLGSSGSSGSNSFGSGGSSGAFGGNSGNTASAGATPAAGGGGADRSGLAGMIQADPASNSLIISAPETLYRNIRSIVDKLDVRPAQVLIESLVAEISADNAQEFGIQWQALDGLNGTSTSVIGGTNFGSTSSPTTNIIGAAQSIGNLGTGLNLGVVKGTINIPGLGSVTNISVLARALETKANANILSRPNIQTLDNEEGKFLVGQNVPFLTGSYSQTSSTATVSPFQTYERHDIGLQLRVKPQISEGGTVRLTIYIEDSTVASTSASAGVTLNKRSFETSVIVEDGNFVVISGMIQDQVNESQSKVPLLGDIPWIGALFRYDTREHVKTQTMVFLRPRVIRDENASHEVTADRYAYIRNELTNAAPERNLVLADMPLAIPPLPPSPAGAAAVAAAEADARIAVAVVDTPREAEQLQRQLKSAGVETRWEPLAVAGASGTQLRILADRGQRSVQDTLALLRGLGYTPTIVRDAGPAVPPVAPPVAPLAAPPMAPPAPTPP
jgi:general secretion pathway protein D